MAHHLPKHPMGKCSHCGRTIFGGHKGMKTHLRKKHRRGGRRPVKRHQAKRRQVKRRR